MERREQLNGEIEKLKESKKKQIADKMIRLKEVSGIQDQEYEKTLKQILVKEFD